MVEVPDEALSSGFKNGIGGVHDSRTIMVAELRRLLEVCPSVTSLEAYRVAVVEDNVLLKGSRVARTGTFRRLRELYALVPRVILFRGLRDLWSADPDGQPLLALHCAVARDPVFRSTTRLILQTPVGEPVDSSGIAETVGAAYPGRYGPGILAKIGRNAASSWTQSGHLRGRVKKVRAEVSPGPPSLAYALLLGYLCGARGDGLFDTLWARLLDAPGHILREQAVVAGQMGWIDYRHAGGVTDISFSYLLREGEADQ